MKSSICAVLGRKIASSNIVIALVTIMGLVDATSRPAIAQTSDAAVATSAADWTQFLRDNMQRWNPFETVLGAKNVGSLQLKWSYDISGLSNGYGLASSPAIANGVVYFGLGDGNVFAVDAETGARLWSYKTGAYVGSSPAVVNGIVYVGSFDGNLYALNATTGEKLWSFPAGSGQGGRSSPAVVNGVVYYDGGITLYALDARTGEKLWSFDDVSGSPAVANGVVYAGANTNTFFALDARTGSKIWSFTVGPEGVRYPPFSYIPPAVADGVVYVPYSNEYLYALDASTGALMWSYTAPGLTGSSPAVAKGLVYIGAEAMYALNAKTGAVVWKFAPGIQIVNAPAVANGIVYFGSRDTNFGYQEPNLYAVDASTGSRLWSVTAASSPTLSPVVVNGVLYSMTQTRVNAFAPGAPADLYLRIEPSSTNVAEGDLLTYAFPVWNQGPGIANNEILNTQVPAGTVFDYVRISGTPGLGTCTTPPYQGTGQIVCHENSSMASNTTWTVRLTVKVTAPAGSTITASAAAMADTPDPNTTNNMATVSVKVQ